MKGVPACLKASASTSTVVATGVLRQNMGGGARTPASTLYQARRPAQVPSRLAFKPLTTDAQQQCAKTVGKGHFLMSSCPPQFRSGDGNGEQQEKGAADGIDVQERAGAADGARRHRDRGFSQHHCGGGVSSPPQRRGPGQRGCA